MKKFSDGKGLLILFHCVDRLIEMHCPRLHEHFKRELISLQMVMANCVITLFTWNVDMGMHGTRFFNHVWDNLMLVFPLKARNLR